MSNIYTGVILSCEKDEVLTEHTGSLRFTEESFVFESEECKLTAATDKIEYISYGNTIFLAVLGDPVDYNITGPKDAFQSIQEEINSLFSAWLKEKELVEHIELVYEKGVPFEVIGVWIERTNSIDHIRRLQKENTSESTEKARKALTILSKIEEKTVISELSTVIEAMASIFMIKYEKASEIEKYVSDPEIQRCSDLQWLKKYFYGIEMGNMKMPILEEMIEESMRKIILKILPTISGKITHSEIRKVFEEVQDSKTLEIFIHQLLEDRILQKIEMLDEADKVYILYHITALDRKALHSYAVDNPHIVEQVFGKFLDSVERRDYELLPPLEHIIGSLLSTENVKLSIYVSECIPYIFEYPGIKTISLVNGWPQTSSKHRLSVYHLQILNRSIQSPPVYIRVYIITSGIVFSIIEKMFSGTETEKYFASSIVLFILTRKDRILQKYIEHAQIEETLKNALLNREVRYTSYSPIQEKILHLVNRDTDDQRTESV